MYKLLLRWIKWIINLLIFFNRLSCRTYCKNWLITIHLWILFGTESVYISVICTKQKTKQKNNSPAILREYGSTAICTFLSLTLVFIASKFLCEGAAGPIPNRFYNWDLFSSKRVVKTGGRSQSLLLFIPQLGGEEMDWCIPQGYFH